ncbi:MAG: alpha/beta fold hydrolase [Sphingomonadaceae bacterium]
MNDWSWEPPADCGITVRMQAANGLMFELAEMAAADGSTDRLALCLHGFPELNFSWRFQMPMLSERGWRVWAPNLRGYGATSRPTGINAYRLTTLVEDVGALIDASGAKEVMLIAHDWGAIIAWHFAILRVRPLAKLVIMNVPHPKVAAREIRQWRQFSKSWYIFFFQLPWIPEWAMGRRRAAAIKGAFLHMAVDKSAFPRETLALYGASAQRPGALTAMLNYYRALLRTPDARTIGDGRVETPTLMIWGEEDTALNIMCTKGTEEWVPNLTLHRLPAVSHWVQQEAPDKVNALLAAWLDG